MSRVTVWLYTRYIYSQLTTHNKLTTYKEFVEQPNQVYEQ